MTKTMTSMARHKVSTAPLTATPNVTIPSTTITNPNGLITNKTPAMTVPSCSPVTVTTSSMGTTVSSCTSTIEMTANHGNNLVPKTKTSTNDTAVFHKPTLPPPPLKYPQNPKTLQTSKPLQLIAPKPHTFIVPKTLTHAVQLTTSKVTMATIPKHPPVQQHLHQHQQQNLMSKSLSNEKFSANNYSKASPSSPSPVLVQKTTAASASTQRILQANSLKIPQNYSPKNSQPSWQKISPGGLQKSLQTNGNQKSVPISSSGNKLQPTCSSSYKGNVKAGLKNEVCLAPKTDNKKLTDTVMNGNKAGSSSKNELYSASLTAATTTTTTTTTKGAKKEGSNDNSKDKLIKMNGNASKTEIAGVS